MANRIKMAMKSTVVELARRGWSFRRIAKELGLHRDTVSRCVRLSRAGPEPSPCSQAGTGVGPPEQAMPTAGWEGGPDSKQAIVTPGSRGDVSSKQAIVIAGSAPSCPPEDGSLPTGLHPPADSVPAVPRPSGGVGQPSRCEPLRGVIEPMFQQGLSAQRIFQDLCVDHGFEGSYSSVKRFVRRLGALDKLPFRRMECAPGAEAQVDFGTGAWIESEGRRRRPHLFRIVLSYSRKAYSEAVWRQTTESLIRCLENAFRAFGGVPQTLVIDNLLAAVKKADWYDPELNPKIEAFCRHYGTVMLPAKPYMPRHKGKVEGGIKYAQNNALKGRVFSSLAAENGYLEHWEVQVADTRIHGTTRRQVREVFEQERAALLPLPPDLFPCYSEGQRVVHGDAHVEVDKSYYSVPPEYVGRSVWVRWDSRLVRILNDRQQQIALHARCGEPGRFSTQRVHLDSRKISRVEMGAGALLKRAFRIGPQAGDWARAMLDERGIEGVRVLNGLLALTRRHTGTAIDAACALALTHGAFRLKTLRRLLARNTQQEQFEFLKEHPLIRQMSHYGRLITVSFQAVPCPGRGGPGT